MKIDYNLIPPPSGLLLALSQVLGALLVVVMFVLLALLLKKLSNRTSKPSEEIEMEEGVRGGDIGRGEEKRDSGIETENENERQEEEKERDSRCNESSVVNVGETEQSNVKTPVYSDTLIISNLTGASELESNHVDSTENNATGKS